MQYNENYSEADFIKLAENVPLNNRHLELIGEDLDDDSEIPFFERNLVYESILESYGVYNELIQSKKDNNDYYIPPKEELLKYSSDLYEPKTPQYIAMRSFIAKYKEISAEEAEECIYELSADIRDRISSPLDAVTTRSVLRDIRIYAEHYYEFEPLYIDLFNHTRNPHLNGYTPEEYLNITNDFDKSMYAVKENIPEKEVSDRLSEAIAAHERFHNGMMEVRRNIYRLAQKNQQPVRKKKIGRNDPCPCGSGKKYKKCCGADL